MGDVKMRRENIRYEARGKSFEIECPQGFASIEAIVCWCDAGGGWHREAFESFLDARGRLDGLLRGEAVMAYVQRTVCMNTADAIDPDMEPVNGQPVLAETSDYGAVVRNYTRGRSTVMLTADSHSGEYDDILAGADDAPVVCKGRIVWYMGERDERG